MTNPVPEIQKLSGAGILTATTTNGSTSYDLNLGRATYGDGSLVANLAILNDSLGLLSGGFTIVNDGAFQNSGFGAFNGLAAGASDSAPTVVLPGNIPGAYQETIILNSSVDGSALPSQTLTIEGEIDQLAVAAIEQLSGNGALTPSGVASSYVLDLGTIAQHAPQPLTANLGALNDVLGAADPLGGSYTISGSPQFVNTGFDGFSGLGAQQVDTAPNVTLSTDKPGTFLETIVLNPTDTRGNGVVDSLAPETVTIVGTVLPAAPPQPAQAADAWGAGHLVTFGGLAYDFEAEGEFVLSQSTVPDNTFEIQARMQPLAGGSSVGVMTMVAARVGDQRVTFAVGRGDAVWVDGASVSTANPVALDGGTLQQISTNTYQINWNTGEQLNVVNEGAYLDVSLAAPGTDIGAVQGLLGPDAGAASDALTLPGGATAAQGSISFADLYGPYADAWRVTDATSLMDYASGQTTATFTDAAFANLQAGLLTLPDAAQPQATAAATAAEGAGITDLNLLVDAITDTIVFGNAAAGAFSANAQEQHSAGTTALSVASSPAATANVGIAPDAASVVASTSGSQSVGFTIYLTSPKATATTVDYAVTAPGAGFLTAADFGGVLPGGSVTIAAGDTTAHIAVTVPANVLGADAADALQVAIAPEGGDPVFAATAQTEIDAASATAGNPAEPTIVLLSGNGGGSISGSGANYTVDLGSIQQYSTPLVGQIGVFNGATFPADALSGGFSVFGSPPFVNSGLTSFNGLVPGAGDLLPKIELQTNETGVFDETLTVTPTDSNNSGHSASLPTVTINVTGTVTAAPPPPAASTGDVWGLGHVVTFDGLYYDFDAAGEFVLTRSTVADDTFEVQARLQPYGEGPLSAQTEVAAEVGAHTIDFSAGQTGAFTLDSATTALGVGQTLNLPGGGGSVQEISTGHFRVNWATGESMTVDTNGAYINESIALTAADAGNVQGLLGQDDGNAAADFRLPDGTLILQLVISNILYGAYANGWRVTDATSLLTYAGGQTTATFTDTNFPADVLALYPLPAGVVAAAEQVVRDAGATDPNLIKAGVFDLLSTGDPHSVIASANVQQQGVGLTGAAIDQPPPLPEVGVVADRALTPEASSGALTVAYTVYLTAAEAQSTTIDYSVTAPGSGYLSLSDVAPGTGSGSVTIAAGQTSARIVVDLPAGALGSAAEANLQITVTPTAGEPLIGATAQSLIANPTPTAGVSPEVVLEALAGQGVLTGSGTSYVLDLGTVAKGAASPYAHLGVLNNATGLADNLFGGFTIDARGALVPATGKSAFVNTGFDAFGNLPAGGSDVAPVVTLKTDTAGTFTETIVLAPTDSNYSGFSASMSPITVTVEGTVECFCRGTRIRTPQGEVAVEDLRRGDLVLTAEGLAMPVSWLGRRTVIAAFADPIRCWPIRVRAGAFGDNVPSRELRLSPDHALLVEGVLIQAGALVNGTSIMRETSVPPRFVYYHVELEDHSLILAENAPAETFVDNVDRLGFDNWAEHEALYPDGKPIDEMPYPRAKARRQVPMKVRAHLDARAKALGYAAAAVA